MLKTKVLIRSFSFYTFFCCCWLNAFRWGTNGHIRFLKILLPILLHLLFIVVVIADVAASSAPVSSASASSSSSPSSTWWFDPSQTLNCSAEVVWLAENRLDVFKILASFLWVCGHISVCLLCPVNHSIVKKKKIGWRMDRFIFYVAYTLLCRRCWEKINAQSVCGCDWLNLIVDVLIGRPSTALSLRLHIIYSSSSRTENWNGGKNILARKGLRKRAFAHAVKPGSQPPITHLKAKQ